MFSSCAQNSIYVEGEFFDKEFLKSQLVENLPDPYGEPLLYVKAHGMNNPTEYIDASLVSSDYSAFTARDVFNYLSASFEHIYAIKQTSKYSTPSVSKYAYDVEETYERGGKMKLIITANKAIGAYKIVKKTIKP